MSFADLTLLCKLAELPRPEALAVLDELDATLDQVETHSDVAPLSVQGIAALMSLARRALAPPSPDTARIRGLAGAATGILRADRRPAFEDVQGLIEAALALADAHDAMAQEVILWHDRAASLKRSLEVADATRAYESKRTAEVEQAAEARAVDAAVAVWLACDGDPALRKRVEFAGPRDAILARLRTRAAAGGGR